MSRAFFFIRPSRTVRSFGRGSLTSLSGIAAVVAVIAALSLPSAQASAIYGTLSNLDFCTFSALETALRTESEPPSKWLGLHNIHPS